MRPLYAILPLAIAATPLAAQPAPKAGPAAPAAQAPLPPAAQRNEREAPIVIPPELNDPAMIGRLSSMTGALTRALLNMPVGEVEAAIEGRPATRADRARTVRDVAVKDDPYFERRIEDQVARSGVVVQSGMRAMTAAMPAIQRALNEAEREIERSIANLPRPDYPRR